MTVNLLNAGEDVAVGTEIDVALARDLIEEGETEKIFNHAANRLTQRYVNGDFG